MCTPPRPQFPSRRGFTLLGCHCPGSVGILTAIGIIMSNDMLPRYRTRAAALQFQAKAQQCRAAAIRSGRECIIRFSAPTQASPTSRRTQASTGSALATATAEAPPGTTSRQHRHRRHRCLPGAGDIGDDTGPHFCDGWAWPPHHEPQAAGYCTGTENCIVFEFPVDS